MCLDYRFKHKVKVPFDKRSVPFIRQRDSISVGRTKIHMYVYTFCEFDPGTAPIASLPMEGIITFNGK